jgi:AraC-like DNA-binding protein
MTRLLACRRGEALWTCCNLRGLAAVILILAAPGITGTTLTMERFSGLQLDPVTLERWLLLREMPTRLRSVTVWKPGEHPARLDDKDYHQHHTVTLVLCLSGVLRIEGGTVFDLKANEALLIQAGTWHRHHPIRPGSVMFGVGYMIGRCDFGLLDHVDTLHGAVPGQPLRQMLEAAALHHDPQTRVGLLGDAIRAITQEKTTALSTPHNAMLDMEYALWFNLHHERVKELIIKASGLSRTHAYRLALEHWGCGIAERIRSARLELARELLGHGLGIGESARRCGFANRHSFSRSFQSHFGIPPSQVAEGPSGSLDG